MAADRQMRRLVEEDGLPHHAGVGDELKVMIDGSDLGGIRVWARWKAGGAAHWDARWFIDHTPRMHKRLDEPSPIQAGAENDRGGRSDHQDGLILRRHCWGSSWSVGPAADGRSPRGARPR